MQLTHPLGLTSIFNRVGLAFMPWMILLASSSCFASADDYLSAALTEVQPLGEKNWSGIVRQQYDYSCGSAALATLLTYHFDLPTSEGEIFVTMFRMGDAKLIQKQGFSLFDMKSYLARLGLNAIGYRLNFEQLTRLNVPAIVLFHQDGYKHFVVVKRIHGKKVLIGDPAYGSEVMDEHMFKQVWNGITLVITDFPRVVERGPQEEKTFAAELEYRSHSESVLHDIQRLRSNEFGQ